MCWMKWGKCRDPQALQYLCECALECLRVCVALNKWPMTHNKNYYEWTRTRKIHWPPLCTPHSPCSPALERMNLACKEAASRIGVSDERSQDEGVRWGCVTNDCYWPEWFAPFGNWPDSTRRNCIGLCATESTCIKIQLRLTNKKQAKWKIFLLYYEYTHVPCVCEILYTSVWGPKIFPSIVEE